MNGNADSYHRYLESNAIYSNIIIEARKLKVTKALSEELYNSFIWRGMPMKQASRDIMNQ